jgi:hypothetical protein
MRTKSCHDHSLNLILLLFLLFLDFGPAPTYTPRTAVYPDVSPIRSLHSTFMDNPIETANAITQPEIKTSRYLRPEMRVNKIIGTSNDSPADMATIIWARFLSFSKLATLGIQIADFIEDISHWPG